MNNQAAVSENSNRILGFMFIGLNHFKKTKKIAFVVGSPRMGWSVTTALYMVASLLCKAQSAANNSFEFMCRKGRKVISQCSKAALF